MARRFLVAINQKIGRVVADQALGGGLRLVLEVPRGVSVKTDPDLLALILQNLIGNGVKYATHGTVRVEAQHVRDAADDPLRWHISVSDEEPGIPQEHREKMFAAFARGTTQGESGVAWVWRSHRGLHHC